MGGVGGPNGVQVPPPGPPQGRPPGTVRLMQGVRDFHPPGAGGGYHSPNQQFQQQGNYGQGAPFRPRPPPQNGNRYNNRVPPPRPPAPPRDEDDMELEGDEYNQYNQVPCVCASV